MIKHGQQRNLNFQIPMLTYLNQGGRLCQPHRLCIAEKKSIVTLLTYCSCSRYKMYERLNWHLLKVDQELFGIKRRYRWRHPLKVWRLFSMLKWSAFLILVLGLTIVKVPPVEIEFEYYQKLDVVRQSSSNLWVEGDSHLFFLFFKVSTIFKLHTRRHLQTPLGTIHILRNHIFMIFGPPSPLT